MTTASNFPIASNKEEIVKTVLENKVTVLTAQTSSGKSSQVCQYLHEAGFHVTVSEPTRMAAVSLADFVGRNYADGIVGYHTGESSTECSTTEILFCTSSLTLIRSLIWEVQKQKPTVLIIDEIHEWSLEQETLVACAEKMLADTPNLRIVIMSATMDKERILDYFSVSTASLDIKGRMFPVHSHIEGARNMTARVVSCIEHGMDTLVLLPGKADILNMEAELLPYSQFCTIIPLHGELMLSEQKRIFLESSIPKVILATNIARTSLTIPGVTAVVDSGLEKRIECRDGVQGLFLHDISKADIAQGVGRAGRTAEGYYYLCSDFGGEREEYSTPEIQRSILDQIVLRILSIGIDARTLRFYHQPLYNGINLSYEVLEMLGACKDNKITSLGVSMAKLPVSARYALMLIEAKKYHLVEQTMELVSILEVGSLLGYNESYQLSRARGNCYSDIDAELDLWNRAQTMNISEQRRNGIHTKQFQRARELYNKLTREVEKQFEISSDGDISNLSNIYLAAMPDRVAYHMCSDEYGLNYDTYQIDRRSILNGEYCELVIGQPSIIEYKPRDGYGTRSLYILKLCCEVNSDMLQKVRPDDFSSEYAPELSYYSPTDDACIITTRVTYRGKNLTVNRELTNDSPYCEELKQAYEMEKNFQSSYYASRNLYPSQRYAAETVMLNGTEYRIENSYLDSIKHISISSENLMNISGIRTVSDSKGKNLTIECGSIASQSIPDLQERVFNKQKSYSYDAMVSSIPSAFTAKTSVIKEYMTYVGQHDYVVFDRTFSAWAGLVAENKKYSIKFFDDIESSELATKDALKFMLLTLLNNQYGVKKFQLIPSTKKCEAARASFMEGIAEFVDDVTIETYDETVDFIEEIYLDSIKEM